VSRSGTTTRWESTRRAKYQGGDDSTTRRSTRRAPPDNKAIFDEENYRFLGILLNKDAPNKESMVDTDKVRR
jgi:hypothetical protein